MRLLHLHVAEVRHRLVVERPVIGRRRSASTKTRSTWTCITAARPGRQRAPVRPGAAPGACRCPGACEAAACGRPPASPAPGAGGRARACAAGTAERTTSTRAAEAGLMSGVAAIGDDAAREQRRCARSATRQAGHRPVHAAAAHLHRSAIPPCGKRHAEVDRTRGGAGVDRVDHAVHAAIAGCVRGFARPRGGGERDASYRLANLLDRNRRAELFERTVAGRDADRVVSLGDRGRCSAPARRSACVPRRPARRRRHRPSADGVSSEVEHGGPFACVSNGREW